MLTKTLQNGRMIPAISYGTWHIPGGSDCVEAVCQALGAGYRSIDTAYSYGNDFYVGKALRDCGIPREEIFLTNKVWKSFRGKDNVVSACKKSLKLMKQDYFDLYLIHWPVPDTCAGWREQNYETWLGLETLYKSGLVRAIGVSNFYVHHLKALQEMEISIPPMVDQLEFHPGFCDWATVEYCFANRIIVQGWSPLGSGELMKNPQLRALAEKYGKTPAQLCLRYATQSGVIPVCRTQTAARMAENLESFDFSISDADLLALRQLSPNYFSGFQPDLNQPE